MSRWPDMLGGDPRVRYELLLSCPDCGDVVVPGERCDLHFDCARDLHGVAYRCPACGRRAAAAIQSDLAATLGNYGFALRKLSVASELREPRPVGAPFTWEDVLSFHEAVDREVPEHLTLGSRREAS